MPESILRVGSLRKHFPTKQGLVRAVDDVSFSVAPGDTFGLVGESGSGKTTIAQCVIGMYAPTSGDTWFKGERINTASGLRPKRVKGDLRIVFQDPGSSLNPRRTIKQILSVPLQVHRTGMDRDRLARMKALLDMVELPSDEYLYKYPQAIGGGEKQMVALARALATNPSFVLLDEPTSALDVSVQGKIINLLIRLQRELELTYLFITHDLSLMRNIASRVAIMYLGKLCEIAPTAEFFEAPLHPYTKMLLSSIPVVSDEEEALKPQKAISKGEIPSPVNVPPGCSFQSRCPVAMDVCLRVDPEMLEVSESHLVRCHLLRTGEKERALQGEESRK